MNKEGRCSLISQSTQPRSRTSRRWLWTACETYGCLAALILSLLSAGCTTGAEELPYQPCGVEERDADGTLSSFVYRVYDDRGNHILSERDDGFDGIVDARFIYQYASDDQLTSATWIYPNNWMLELNLQYRPDGQRSSATWSGALGQGSAGYEYYDDSQDVTERWDRDDDGVAEETQTYTYNPDGWYQGYTVTCGDSADPVKMFTIEYNDEGRILRTENHWNGELTSFAEFLYNDDGSLSRVEVKTSSGMLRSRTSYEYDSGGNLTSRTYAYSVSSTGSPTSWIGSFYDTNGRILRSETYVDEMLDSTVTYLYECPGFEDSPGRKIEVPTAPYRGPRGKADYRAVTKYVYSAGFCEDSAAGPGMTGTPWYEAAVGPDSAGFAPARADLVLGGTRW